MFAIGEPWEKRPLPALPDLTHRGNRSRALLDSGARSPAESGLEMFSCPLRELPLEGLSAVRRESFVALPPVGEDAVVGLDHKQSVAHPRGAAAVHIRNPSCRKHCIRI